ncbi:hypothetical protein QAD02_002799 [Eretmocerus hayati]|uniref:Uncharacterized protein n=1 Tax=Eretmocerus hayati TaxID=131215 RepID=A0ACC2NK34_9HYME|nr:hypothetical protein QAD02_002799 [Eretmocerus hayati]
MASISSDNTNLVIFELCDKKHLVKNFVKELYELGKTCGELGKKGTIDHVKECFTYAIAQNKGESVNLADTLRQIPDHLFGNHKNCGEWCESDRVHAVQLKDPKLYDASSKIFEKYAQNANKFSIAASSQPNESVNNMVAYKSEKDICLSQSESCDFKVASEVCVKNDGEQSILEIEKN